MVVVVTKAPLSLHDRIRTVYIVSSPNSTLLESIGYVVVVVGCGGESIWRNLWSHQGGKEESCRKDLLMFMRRTIEAVR